jgi:hypothetical protein
MVRRTDASEIMAMEQELIDGGMKIHEVRSMCDLHSQVTRDILVPLKAIKTMSPGHPVETFRRENAALSAVIKKGRELLAETANLVGSTEAAELLDRMRRVANDLIEVDKHYQRKEHALFSCLERHGISGPSKVMWAKDDEAREAVKAAIAALRGCVPTTEECRSVAPKLLVAIDSVEEMIYKEENILLPMALQTLTEEEWGEVFAVSPKYGWCLVEPLEDYVPTGAAKEGIPADGQIMMPTGNVSLEQLNAVLSILPIHLTFVDAEDKVAFFSEGPERVFPRSKAIIGRKVQNCHPPRSVETVERILADFREHREDVAEFWIEFQGKFIHIRYFAVRDAAGKYLGTLEVTQDVTGIRSLLGERRLLEYEEHSSAAAN